MSLREQIKSEYLVISEEVETVLNQIKEDIPVKVKINNKHCSIISSYGVFENIWYCVALNDEFINKIEEEGQTSKDLEYFIDYRKDEMLEEDFIIENLEFLYLDNMEDYKKYVSGDLYEDMSIKNYSINNVYISNNNVIIETNNK